MADSYYALTLNASGTSSAAYYSVTPTSNLTISQGGVTCAPSSPTSTVTMVNIYPQTLQISAPAGLVSAGVTIITSAGEISGRTVISPPVDVAVTVTLYGNGGAPIGQQVYDPGTDGGTFTFATPDGSGFPDAESARGEIEKFVKAPEPTY